jgi:predicted TIM-barrel fold metal-dependent hydrolase
MQRTSYLVLLSTLGLLSWAAQPMSAQQVRPQAAANSPATEDRPQVKHLIDTHIHLYDTTRKGGVPWPPVDDEVLYKPHLPDEFKRVAQPAGVTGVVIVEASDRLVDNQWVLDAVKDDPFYVALVGNIDPYREDFEEQLGKLRRDPRFVGIRVRVRGKDVDYADPQVVANLGLLAKANLSADILMNGQGVERIQDVDRLARAIPDLHIIINHVLGYDIDGRPPSKEWIAAVARLAENKNVYVKVSGLYQRCAVQPASQDPAHYRALLDVLWDAFGSKRLVYGSNWPCTKKSGDYASFVKLVNAYFADKGQAAAENYFWKNAAEAYRLKLSD